ncbi:hypothetical protein MMC26_006689 [Xylographa opegraphella]|nr:hypothetical protein [Xylographa opegraphella]
MAPSSAKREEKKQQQHHKLKRLPNHARIEKRPILHPAIPSPYTNASQPKVIYVSSSTPFISVVKRVRKLLAQVDKRAMGKVDLVGGKGSDRQRLSTLGKQHKEPEEVTLKATNKAIERALGLALFFQGQQDCRVRLRTGSVGVIDDIVVDEKPAETRAEGKSFDGAEMYGNKDAMDDGQSPTSDESRKQDDEELPETQIRYVSVLEVGISLQ